MDTCQSCNGTGEYTLGDCEDGVTEECLECQGTGQIDPGDVFIPERDAWTPRD
jgi:DnaJ-class molecular chaperone